MSEPARASSPWVLVVVLVLWQGLTPLARPLWMDEAIQGVVATDAHPWTALGAHDMHPPLLTALLRLTAWVSHSEIALRAPSYLAWIGTIAAIAWAAHTWQQPKAALPAAALVASMPHVTLYAFEARPYALAALGVTLLLALVPTARTVTMTLVASLTSLTVYATWPIVLLAGALHARRAPDDRQRWLTLALPAVLMVLVGATLARTQLTTGQGAGLSTGALSAYLWTPATLPAWCFEAGLGFVGWSATGAFPRLAPYLGIPIGLVAIGLLVRSPRDGLTALAWLPLLAFIALAGLGLHPLGPTRHVLVLVPAGLLWGVVRLGRARGLALVAVLPLLLLQRFAAPKPQSDPLIGLTAPLDGPLLADASAVFGTRWYNIPTIGSLPWTRGQAFADALSAQAPPESFWVVGTQARIHMLPELRRWSERQHRKATGLVQDGGGWAIQIQASHLTR